MPPLALSDTMGLPMYALCAMEPAIHVVVELSLTAKVVQEQDSWKGLCVIQLARLENSRTQILTHVKYATLTAKTVLQLPIQLVQHVIP